MTFLPPLVLAAASLGGAPAEDPLPSPLDGMGVDAVRALGGWNWVYYSLAASSLVLSPTGADHSMRVWVQTRIPSKTYGDAVLYGGYVLPVIVGPGLYLSGVLGRERSLAGAGSAATQALGFTVLTTLFLKVSTGRPFPLHGGDPHAPDRLEHPEYAREFSPFGFAGRYAWPSGHTSSAMSIAASLTAYASDSLVVPAIAYPLAVGIGAGMIVGDHHWASDVIAGALIGQAIGWSVGTSFRERADGERATGASRFFFVPLVGEIRGCAIGGEL